MHSLGRKSHLIAVMLEMPMKLSDVRWLKLNGADFHPGRILRYKAKGPLFAASIVLKTIEDGKFKTAIATLSGKIPLKSWAVVLQSRLEFNNQNELVSHEYKESTETGDVLHVHTLHPQTEPRVLDPVSLFLGFSSAIDDLEKPYYASFVIGKGQSLLRLSPVEHLTPDEVKFFGQLITVEQKTDLTTQINSEAWLTGKEFEMIWHKQHLILTQISFSAPIVGRVNFFLET